MVSPIFDFGGFFCFCFWFLCFFPLTFSYIELEKKPHIGIELSGHATKLWDPWSELLAFWHGDQDPFNLNFEVHSLKFFFCWEMGCCYPSIVGGGTLTKVIYLPIKKQSFNNEFLSTWNYLRNFSAFLVR